MSCKNCGADWHTAFNCPRKPRKPLSTSKPLKATKRMKQVGGITKKWLAVRSEWLKQNPPNHRGNYVCYLCGVEVWYTEITLDHVKSRSRYPELRYELDSLRPCCSTCNALKGSRDITELTNKENL